MATTVAESGDAWQLLLEGLVERGIGQPQLIVSHGNKLQITTALGSWVYACWFRATIRRPYDSTRIRVASASPH